MHNKRIFYIISILLVINITILIYLTSLNTNAFNEKFYKKEFQKYRVYETFPGKDIDEINSGLLSYLKDKKDSFNTELFNQREISHLKDVKLIFQKIAILYYSSTIIAFILLIILFYLDKKHFLKNLSKMFLWSGLFTVVFTLILLISILLGFDGVFSIFHKIFFPQGNYLFANTENIIKLYPTGLFYDIAKAIFIHILVYGNILIGMAILFHRK